MNSYEQLDAAQCTTSGAMKSQINDTYRWLDDNFEHRPSVSISRSTIYELYQKFCQQHGYLPVCKATFGKVIRKKFQQIKSKRLGARGQSKYHYYNITFRADRSRPELANRNGPPSGATLLDILQQQQQPNQSITGDGWSNGVTPEARKLAFEPNWQHDGRVGGMLATSSAAGGAALVSSNPSRHRLSSFSNSEFSEPGETDFLSPNLNENDYHTVIQSMLSYIKIPLDEPLVDHKSVFVNLYKIHCQCLLDSALSSNYVQMRHYLQHFWQQLPRHIELDLGSLVSLDQYMFHLLESIYLPTISASTAHLKHLSTIAHLLPMWLEKTFAYLSTSYEHQWRVIDDERRWPPPANNLSVCELKVSQAIKWRDRIQFKICLVSMFHKLEQANGMEAVLKFLSRLVSLLLGRDQHCLPIVEPVFHAQAIQARQYVLSTPCWTLFAANEPASEAAFVDQWYTLLEHFYTFLQSLAAKVLSDDNLEDDHHLPSQLVIDNIDQLLHGLCSSYPYQAASNRQMYCTITLHLTRLFDDLKQLVFYDQIENEEAIDEEVFEDDEGEEEEDIDDHRPSQETMANTHLFLDAVHTYLIEICRFNM